VPKLIRVLVFADFPRGKIFEGYVTSCESGSASATKRVTHDRRRASLRRGHIFGDLCTPNTYPRFGKDSLSSRRCPRIFEVSWADRELRRSIR